MSMIVDSRQTFFDAEGQRLSGGRLRFFVWGTTTPATVYSDLDHQTPIEGAIQLTSAGWAPFEIYSSQDLDVRADRFIGLDEYGVESYLEVKSFRFIGTGSGSSGGSTVSMAVVESIADLRELPTTFSSCMVLGYHTKGDCPARTFINVPASAAIDNSGTTVGSTVDPTMRWIWTPDCNEIDCRTFGVIASASTTVNSQLSSFLNYCDSNKAIAHFPAGTYQLAPGSLTVGCAIKADKDLKIHSNNGEYALRITNPDFGVVNTFAGTGLKLVLEGSDNWCNTIVPMTAWNTAAKGYDVSTARYMLRLNNGSTVYDWAGVATELEKIICDVGTHIITGDPEVYVYDVEGAGKIQWSSTATFAFRRFRTSMTANYTSILSTRVSELLTVDTDVTFATGTTIGALIHVMPSGSVAFGASCQADKGVVGYHGCIKGSNGFTSDAEVDIVMYELPNTAMKSWNKSSATNAFDLKSRTVTEAPTKPGKIINGAITADIAVDMIFDNLTFIGYFSGGALTANKCLLKHTTAKPIGGGTSTNLTDCTVYAPVSITIEDGVQALWTRVNVQAGSVIKYGSGGLFRDVWIAYHAIFVPGANKSFGNFSWIGGSAVRIDLDANRCASNGACSMYNVHIQGIINLSGGIRASSLNTTRAYWGNTGHYNVMIGDNERGPATYGWASGTQTAGGDSLVFVGSNSTDILWLTKNHTSDDLLSFAHVWNIAEYNSGAPNSNWSGEGYFRNYPPGTPSIEGSRTRGDVRDNSKCTYQFEIYKKVL